MFQQNRPDDIIRRIRGEYLEMPGLALTLTQAQRLWGLDRGSVDQLLNTLVDGGFLFRTQDGQFMRYDAGSPHR